MHNHVTHRIAVAYRPLVLALLSLHLGLGCATPWEKSALLKENLPNVSGVQGPYERSMRNWFRKKQDEEDAIAGKSLKPIPGTEDYLAATEIYKAEKYAEAQKKFHKIHKNRKYKKSEIREDALFMEAEAAWQQDHYAAAHDAYAVLLKDFPSTRHLNVVSERLFKIGRLWLEFPEVAKISEIQQVNFDQPTKPLPSDEPPKVPKKKAMFIPNFRDKKEPLFDTPGNGVASLTAVWMNDPTGPLADDAMMLVASYHARRGNYVEADRYFQNLRELYPNSPHVQNAFILGSHVKLMSYQGPAYETRSLREAQLLKESTLNLYPNHPDAARMRDELAKIEESKAEVLWNQALFYHRKNKKRAAAVYCHDLISQFPKSEFAEKARAKLVEMGPEFESGAAFLNPLENQQRSLLERILEPTPPDWVKNPRKLMSSRSKSSTKISDKSQTGTTFSPVREATNRRKDSADDADDDDSPSSDNSKNSGKPRRLRPFNSSRESPANDNDADASSP